MRRSVPSRTCRPNLSTFSEVYLLDTNILSDVINRPFGVVARHLDGIDPDTVCTSIIVACEVMFGAELKASPKLQTKVERALLHFAVLPFGDDCDLHYARLRVDLQRRGLPIGANDMLIAAHALALGATLVTDNVREFERVEGLAVENWLRPE